MNFLPVIDISRSIFSPFIRTCCFPSSHWTSLSWFACICFHCVIGSSEIRKDTVIEKVTELDQAHAGVLSVGLGWKPGHNPAQLPGGTSSRPGITGIRICTSHQSPRLRFHARQTTRIRNHNLSGYQHRTARQPSWIQDQVVAAGVQRLR